MSKLNPGDLLDDMVEKYGGTRMLWAVAAIVLFVLVITAISAIA